MTVFNCTRCGTVHQENECPHDKVATVTGGAPVLVEVAPEHPQAPAPTAKGFGAWLASFLPFQEK